MGVSTVDDERHEAARAAATARLREVGSPRLYQVNAFRITGLAVDAGRPAVRRHQQRILKALEAGADVDLGHSLPVTSEQVRGAFELILNSPHHRLVDELFWKWDVPDPSCTCPPTLHRDHDAAVAAHAAALDLELLPRPVSVEQLAQTKQLWAEAGELWKGTLRRAASWDHLRQRIAVLDERELDESIIETLREKAPLTLVQALTGLVGTTSGPQQERLITHAYNWPASAQLIDDQLEHLAAPIQETVDEQLGELRALIEAGKFEQVATTLYQRVLPALTRLAVLLPAERFRNTATSRDRAAIVFNNCAMGLLDRDDLASAAKAKEWFGAALEHAGDSRTDIQRNLTQLDEVLAQLDKIKSQVDDLVSRGSLHAARAIAEHQTRDTEGRQRAHRDRPHARRAEQGEHDILTLHRAPGDAVAPGTEPTEPTDVRTTDSAESPAAAFPAEQQGWFLGMARWAVGLGLRIRPHPAAHARMLHLGPTRQWAAQLDRAVVDVEYQIGGGPDAVTESR
jgi:hypothetical protein